MQKMMSYGWTNVSYLGVINDKKVVAKIFYFNLRTLLLFMVYILCSFLRFEIPPMLPVRPKSRMRNEIRAQRILKGLGINVPKVTLRRNLFLADYIDGLNMHDFLEKNHKIESIEKIAYLKGMEIGKLHKNGYALVDNKTSNTIITSDMEIYSIDHEFFCLDSKKFQRELDLITLFATIPSDISDEFWKSFCIGYKEAKGNMPEIKRKDILGISMIGFNLLKIMGFL